jgi:hypothetical protein
MTKRMMTGRGACAVVLVYAAGFLGGCRTNPVLPQETEVVLQGYLYAGQPVTDIRVTASVPIGASDSTYPPITDASVVLVRNGTTYALAPTPGSPGYYEYAGTDLSVVVGDAFSIQIRYGGEQVTAQTSIPSTPQGLGISTTLLRFQVDSMQTPNGTFRTIVQSLDTALVSWNNSAGDYYYVVVESVDPSRQLLRLAGTATRLFISQPTNQATYVLNGNSILYTGEHRLRLFHINKEYADLYRSRQQDSRTLNEPLTNVVNGLGIFSAFASDSLSFMVTLN